MCVESDIVSAGAGVHETIPVSGVGLEGVVDGDNCVLVVLAHSSPAIVVVFLHGVHVEIRPQRLVDELDHGHGGVTGIALGHRVDGGDGSSCAGVGGLPVYGAEMARVVEAVLGARCYVLHQLLYNALI